MQPTCPQKAADAESGNVVYSLSWIVRETLAARLEQSKGLEPEYGRSSMIAFANSRHRII
jgi:hypothetical protein